MHSKVQECWHRGYTFQNFEVLPLSNNQWWNDSQASRQNSTSHWFDWWLLRVVFWDWLIKNQSPASLPSFWTRWPILPILLCSESRARFVWGWFMNQEGGSKMFYLRRWKFICCFPTYGGDHSWVHFFWERACLLIFNDFYVPFYGCYLFPSFIYPFLVV